MRCRWHQGQVACLKGRTCLHSSGDGVLLSSASSMYHANCTAGSSNGPITPDQHIAQSLKPHPDAQQSTHAASAERLHQYSTGLLQICRPG